ncbi:hypothetical protein NDU88_000578 [Pleurodeles waltl]|uniref:Trm112 family protein n=1 Tax=Pleurodeles waltl TaxID=8319 RepID=A0AAV7P5D2_PLEWA|nr:hypothetical protein NDU88_000578 [Pleurodeles waltl]
MELSSLLQDLACPATGSNPMRTTERTGYVVGEVTTGLLNSALLCVLKGAPELGGFETHGEKVESAIIED